VTLDGYPQMADTSNPQSDTCYQKQLFTARNLAPGHHHMTIEVIHQRDATTNGSWINVDAIDITIRSLVAGAPPAATGLVESRRIRRLLTLLTGFRAPTRPIAVAILINDAVDPGSSMNRVFNGTGITWFGYRDEWSGIAQVTNREAT
jgi:hypothetical protein